MAVSLAHHWSPETPRVTPPAVIHSEAVLPPLADVGGGLKILLYSHDTSGLGNIRRTLLLAQELRSEYPDSSILVVTGSPMIHAFELPENVDYIKLPCVERVAAERYSPRFLADCTSEVKRTREGLLRRTVLGFAPHLMIVDKRPTGIDDELISTLRALRARGHPCRLVLGIRDILDTPARTRPRLHNSAFFRVIDEFYDEVWIYGVPEIFDAVAEYAFPPSVAAKTIYCGYLKRPVPPRRTTHAVPRILVTAGGGGDGGDLIEAYLEGLLDVPRRVLLHTVVVFGPQMDGRLRQRFRERYGDLPDVELQDFTPDLSPRYMEADLVVSMAGYNTICELLSCNSAAVLVPRATPVAEQLIRARIFAGLGRFTVVEPTALRPRTLLDAVLHSLGRSEEQWFDMELSGLLYVRARVRALLAKSDA